MVLGGILGFQRGQAEKPAGLRDLILICAGAALFTVVSVYGFGITDQARVAAGIVTGIGFLGAGVILRRDDSNVVKGLTTAATIWITAGIGMAAGSGMYILAVAVTVMVFLVLILPWRFNKKD
jgi:putative Mg2+ transporter-C (MgtC) family protein